MKQIGLMGMFAIALLVIASCRGDHRGVTSGLTSSISWSSIQQQIQTEFPQVEQLSTAQLSDWRSQSEVDQPILLDVRHPEEYAVSHLKQAHQAETLEEALVILNAMPKDYPIVLYCSVGYRSSALAKAIMAKGYTQVYNLEGSLFAWANEGRPIYQGEQVAQQVHPYSPKWGQLLEKTFWDDYPFP